MAWGRKSYAVFKLKEDAFRKRVRGKLGGTDCHLVAHRHLILCLEADGG